MARGFDPPPAVPLDRRPIAARRLGVFRAMAAALARRGVKPNSISIAGMTAAIAAGALLALTGCPAVQPVSDRLLLLLAAGLIQLRLLANMLDGMVAVEGNLRSPTGELYNEAPDRVSDAAVLIGAGYAIASASALGYLAAIGAVFVAYTRALGKGSGHPADFRGPMAKQQRMAIVTLACLYLAVVPESLHPTWNGHGLMSGALVIIFVGCLLTAWRRLRLLAIRLRAAGLPGQGGPA